MPRPWQGNNRLRLRREMAYESRQTRISQVSVDIRVTPTSATLVLIEFAPVVSTPRVVTPGKTALILTTFAPVVSTPRLVTPGTAALILTRFAPAVTTPRLATPTKRTLSLATFAPVVTATGTLQQPSSGGAAGQRYVVSRPLQRALPLQPRFVRRAANPVRLSPATQRLQLRTFRPLVRVSDHQRVVPGTGRFLYGVSDEFWSLNRALLLAEIDPDLVEEPWKNDSKAKSRRSKLPVLAMEPAGTPSEG